MPWRSVSSSLTLEVGNVSLNIGATSAPAGAIYARSASQVNGPSRGSSDNPLQNLTSDDLELVYQATGQRITKDSQGAPLFAFMLGIDRGQGRIPQNQPVGADYLRDAIKDMRSHPGSDQSLADQAELALKYLTDGRVPGRQLSL